MSANNKTYQPLCYFSIKSGEDLLPNRFINHTGLYTANEERCLGVVDSKWLSGEFASAIIVGTAVVETTEAMNAGDNICSTTDGKAKMATGTMPVNGRCLDTISGAGFVRILLGS